MKSKRYSLSEIVPLSLLLLLLPLTASGIYTTTTTNIAATAVVSSAAAPSFPNESCVSYDPSKRIITIRCRSTTLTDIDNQLNNDSILDKQPNNGVWLLNAGIIVDEGAVLNIDSKDVKWLKIIADGTAAYPIEVLGGLKIDSVKVTSWNPKTNDYAQSYGSRETSGKITHPGAPR